MKAWIAGTWAPKQAAVHRQMIVKEEGRIDWGDEEREAGDRGCEGDNWKSGCHEIICLRPQMLSTLSKMSQNHIFTNP